MSRLDPMVTFRDRLETWPTWAVLLGFFALTRAVVALVVQGAALCCQNPAGVGTLTPSYADMVGVWDGTWYRQIAEHGYPAGLPVDGSDGSVTYSAWAFYPLFPLLVRGLMALGMPFELAAVALNVGLGALAVLLVWAVLSSAARTVLHRRMALLATLLWCLHPATAVLQVAYSEALAAALLAGFLLLLVRRRYLAATAVVLLLGLTRAVAPPLALVVSAHVVLRWRRDVSTGARPLGGERPAAALLLLATTVSAVAWPLYVGLRTGRIRAFFEVQAAWGQRPDKGPFVSWVAWAWQQQGVVGVLLLVAMVAAYVSLVLGRHGRWLAVEIRAWALAYPLYLLAVLRPITSMWRFLLLDFPLAALVVSMAVRGADGGHVTAGWPRRLLVVTGGLVVGIVAWTTLLLTSLPWAARPP